MAAAIFLTKFHAPISFHAAAATEAELSTFVNFIWSRRRRRVAGRAKEAGGPQREIRCRSGGDGSVHYLCSVCVSLRAARSQIVLQCDDRCCCYCYCYWRPLFECNDPMSANLLRDIWGQSVIRRRRLHIGREAFDAQGRRDSFAL
jgi:hypothetical protein